MWSLMMKTNHNAISHEEDQSLYMCHYVISYDVIAYNHYVIGLSLIKETYHKMITQDEHQS